MRKYITEFIGTFFLVLIIIMTGKPIVIGSVLMVMVYAGRHISGAHYNPAITLAIFIRGKIRASDVIPYILVQLAGAIVAVLIASWIMGYPEVASLSLDGKISQALVAEIIGTFALTFVILIVATAKRTAGNSYYGLAIGFTVFALAEGFGTISGGAFNPAVAFGLTFSKAFEWTNIWIYLVGCFGGSALAALVFRIINPEDK